MLETDLVGQTLGAYRIVEQIGRGGMAVVYKAYEPALDRYVAVKVLPQYFAHDPDFVARFEREAKAIAKLDHPNILPIYSYGQEASLTYIAMRYVKAGTLREMLGRPLGLEASADILRRVGEALDYAHQQGIVHRDVKPSNVLMAEGRWALLTDFGLARMLESSVQLTKSGVGVGTPAYMSPEQGQGLKVDARSDVYSLGVMLYEMVTGQVPYDAETPMAVVLKHITAPLPLPRSLRLDLPEAVERVILKALAKAPEDRYQTAAEMVVALERAVAEAPGIEGPPEAKPTLVEEMPSAVTEPILAPAPTVTVGAPPVTRRGLPAWAWGVIGAIALLVVAGGVLIATRGKEATPTPGATTAFVAAPTASAPATTMPSPAPPTATPVPPTPISLTPPEVGKMVEVCKDTTPPQICVRDIKTGQVTQLTNNLEFGAIDQPVWSPDAQQIAFTAGSDWRTSGQSDHQLYIISADGSGLRQVTSGGGNAYYPAWSPDGRWIAYHNGCALWIIRPNGLDAQELVPGCKVFTAEYMAWSPDSQRIAILNNHVDIPATEIWVVNRDGSNPHVIYTPKQRVEGRSVAWSPDGQLIAFTYNEGGKNKSVLIPGDGSGKPQVIEGEQPWWWLHSFWPQP